MQGKIVRLDPKKEGVNFEPRDWRVCAATFGVMHHLPTGAQYFVDLPGRPFATDEDGIEITQFRARLSYVPQGEEEPSRKEQIEQGRAAIAVFLIEKGLWEPEIRDIPDPPKRCRSVRQSKKLMN
jgi:hypothetical protein